MMPIDDAEQENPREELLVDRFYARGYTRVGVLMVFSGYYAIIRVTHVILNTGRRGHLKSMTGPLTLPNMFFNH